MEPASSIIKKCGGPTKVADHLGVHPTRVHAWKRSKGRGGTGGIIPMKHAQVLLRDAKQLGADLLPEHFFPDFASAAEGQEAQPAE